MNKNQLRKETVQTARYDIAGNNIIRVSRLSHFARFIPVGNLGGGPGGRCLLVLLMLHSPVGRFLYWFKARYSSQAERLKRIVKVVVRK